MRRTRLLISSPNRREAAPGHRVACHFFESLPRPAEAVAASGPDESRFAVRLAAYEAARQAGG